MNFSGCNAFAKKGKQQLKKRINSYIPFYLQTSKGKTVLTSSKLLSTYILSLHGYEIRRAKSIVCLLAHDYSFAGDKEVVFEIRSFLPQLKIFAKLQKRHQRKLFSFETLTLNHFQFSTMKIQR